MKFQPCGWAETLMGALTECLRNLRKFEYESPELPAATSEDGAQLVAPVSRPAVVRVS